MNGSFAPIHTAGTPLRDIEYSLHSPSSVSREAMPTTLPKSVREHLGEEAAADLSRWFAENLSQNVVLRDEYREVLSRLDVLENEVAGINERLDRFEDRFNQIDQRFDSVNERFDRLHEQMRVQTRWSIGTIALFGTIVTVLLAVAEFGA